MKTHKKNIIKIATELMILNSIKQENISNILSSIIYLSLWWKLILTHTHTQAHRISQKSLNEKSISQDYKQLYEPKKSRERKKMSAVNKKNKNKKKLHTINH